MLKMTKDLQPGDLVDLAGDPYADPDSDNLTFEDELVEVEGTEVETPSCILVYFCYDACGFPPNHKVRVLGHVDQDTGEVERWD